MDEVFVVAKHGVGQHGVHGVSASKSLACKMCNDQASNDIDSYHGWAVYRVPLDELCGVADSDGFTDDYDNPCEVYRIKGTIY